MSSSQLGSLVWSPGSRSCTRMDLFFIWGWNLSCSGCAGPMYDPRPISDRPVGLGFPHRAGRFRPRGSQFSSPGCRSCKGVEGFMIRGWNPIVPGWRWLYARAPANQHSSGGVGVNTPWGAVSTRGTTVFVSGFSEFRCMEGFLNRGWVNILPGCDEIVGLPGGAIPAVRASPPHWPRPGAGGASANGIGARKTLG